MSTTDEMADLIAEYMSNFSEDVTTGVKKAVDTVAKEVNAEIKKHVTFEQPTRKYVKAFRIKGVHDSRFNKGKVWYVSGNAYRLTHLLEKGHVNRDGGRTRKYPHIIYGEELAQRRMEELAREAIENAGR